jgi:hypothetical protein
MSGHLSYGLQTRLNLIGTEAIPVTLTNNYGDNFTVFQTYGVAMVTFYINYTAQTSGNSILIALQGSPDTKNDTTQIFYEDASLDINNGNATIVPTQYTYASQGTSVQGLRVSFPCADASVRVLVKEIVASGTAGTVSVVAIVGPND